MQCIVTYPVYLKFLILLQCLETREGTIYAKFGRILLRNNGVIVGHLKMF